MPIEKKEVVKEQPRPSSTSSSYSNNGANTNKKRQQQQQQQQQQQPSSSEQAALTLLAPPSGRVGLAVALAGRLVAHIGAVLGRVDHAVAVLAAELGMEAEVRVQTRLARLLLHVHGTVALAGCFIAAARHAAALVALGEAVVAGGASAALASDHVRPAVALTAERFTCVCLKAALRIAGALLGAVVVLCRHGDNRAVAEG